MIDNVDRDDVAKAQTAYDRACGAAAAASEIGFLLALALGFWLGESMPYKYAATAVIAFAVMLAVRAYYARRVRVAQDAYHRVAQPGSAASSST